MSNAEALDRAAVERFLSHLHRPVVIGTSKHRLIFIIIFLGSFSPSFILSRRLPRRFPWVYAKPTDSFKWLLVDARSKAAVAPSQTFSPRARKGQAFDI